MQIIWVSDADGDDSYDGSRQHPYKTIDKALTVFTNQDQIRLLDGVYTPQDSIVIDGLEGSIFSENPGGATIQPAKTTLHQAGLAILNSPRFSLWSFNVLQAADPNGNLIGIYVDDVDNFLAVTLDVSGFSSPSGTMKGIFARGTGRLERCHVHNMVGGGPELYGIHCMGIKGIDCEVDNLSGLGNVFPMLFDGDYVVTP